MVPPQINAMLSNLPWNAHVDGLFCGLVQLEIASLRLRIVSL